MMKEAMAVLIIGLLLASSVTIVGAIDETSFTVDEKLVFTQLQVESHDGYSHLSLNGAEEMLMSQGHCMVPITTRTYTFPEHTTIHSITVTPQHITTQTLSQPLPLTPVPVPLTATSQVIQEETSIESIGWAEYTIGHGLISHNERGVIVKIELHPTTYDTEARTISTASSLEIDIDYTLAEAQPIIADDENYDLLILSADQFADGLSSLVTHKNDIGTTTKLVTMSEIESGSYFPLQGRDDAEEVKYFIKNAIEEWRVTYVLLVGHSSSFPARITNVKVSSSDTEHFVSDLYYADIYNATGAFSSWDSNENDLFCEFDWGSNHSTDEIDFFPDVLLGRLPIYLADDLPAVVNKIIAYENSLSYTQEWFTNMVVAGGDTFPGDDDSTAEGEYTNQAIMNVMPGYSFAIHWASNGELQGTLPTGLQKLKDSINAGAGFMDLSGHGAHNVWATHPSESAKSWLPTPTGGFYSGHADSLENEGLPIIVIGACSTAKYNNYPDCLAWSFVSNPDGGGIASFGCSALGYGYMGNYVIKGLIGKIELDLFKSFSRYDATTIGEMLSITLNRYIENNMGGGDVKMVTELHLFGDPSIAIAEQSQSPATPVRPSGDESGKFKEEHVYVTSSTDPDGDDLYYQFDWGDDTYSAWLGPFDSGDEISGTRTWESKGDYEIRVKCKDTHGKQSEWSDPLPVSMSYRFDFTDYVARFFDNHPMISDILLWIQDTF